MKYAPVVKPTTKTTIAIAKPAAAPALRFGSGGFLVSSSGFLVDRVVESGCTVGAVSVESDGFVGLVCEFGVVDGANVVVSPGKITVISN